MKKVVVTGISDGHGAGALMEDGKWCGVVLLRPWRAPDGKVHPELLHVRLPPSKSSDAAMKESGRVRRMRSLEMEVELLPKRPNMLTAARVVGRVARVKPSPELAGRDAELSKVVSIRDPFLGRMQRGAKASGFVGRIRLLGRRATLTIWQEDDNAPPEKTVGRASIALRKLEPKLAGVPPQIAKKMLRLARDWQEDDGRPPISQEKLQRQLRLVAVSVPEKGSRIDLDFGCGDVFADHGVAARVSLSGRVLDASIVG